MKRLKYFLIALFAAFLLTAYCLDSKAAPPNVKSKFYDFSEQIIDGEIKRPTGIYTDARQKVKFTRLLKLKKSFLPRLFKTSKNKVFK